MSTLMVRAFDDLAPNLGVVGLAASGDALGLTPVAVNRALQDFRGNGWITAELR